MTSRISLHVIENSDDDILHFNSENIDISDDSSNTDSKQETVELTFRDLTDSDALIVSTFFSCITLK